MTTPHDPWAACAKCDHVCRSSERKSVKYSPGLWFMACPNCGHFAQKTHNEFKRLHAQAPLFPRAAA